jgi:hypothetical protein
MKKVLLSLLSIAISFTAMQPSQAQDQKVLAIIDTAINSNNFPSIIHEVCFTTVKSKIASQNMSCPNGELFMEGKGAASAPWPASINSGTYHGDSMVKAALATDPSLKIVFIRFADVTVSGNHRGDAKALTAAMDWVSKNASKFSIDALSISQSGVSTDLKTKARVIHPACTDATTINAVSQLNANNVPTFAATGNDGLSNLVGFPACIDGVIGVGAMGSPTQFEKATNRGPGLDLVALGRVSVTKYNGSATDISGSSGATVVSAASYTGKSAGKSSTEYLSSLVRVTLSGVSYPYASK